ncbi:hypothetical protein ACPPVO_09170 [Dactylosporangium sp. McL0621]|uniref:hypothetical protein n=1 Tax=Dactylosporangium sp. McL0621 TaxID=3415678 RepID=UPI003CEB9391
MTQPPTTPGPDEPAGYPLRPSTPGGPADDQPPPLYTPPPAQPPYEAQPSFGAQPPYGAQPPAGDQSHYGAQPSYGAQSPAGDQSPYGAQPPVGGQPPYGSEPPYGSQPALGGQPPFGAQPPYGAQPPAGGQPPAVPQYGVDPTYDPSQAYVVYQAAPTFGYGVPAAGQQAGFDPMISPDYGGWWQRSLTIFKGAWKQLAVLQFIGFVLTLAVVIPEAIWSIKATADVIDSADANGNASLTPLIAPFALLFLGAVVAGMVGSLITVAGNQIAVTVAAGLPPRLGPALAVAVRRFLPLWGWQILSALMMGVGLCLCVLPGIYLYAVFLILPAVVTFERGSGAISRCFQLFHRDFGSAIARIASIVGLTVLAGIVSYFVGRIIELAMGGVQQITVGDGTVSSTALTSTVIVTIAVSRIVTTLLETGMKMLTDVLTVTAYADMRARNEPLTTAQLASEAGIEMAPASEWVAPPPAAA